MFPPEEIRHTRLTFPCPLEPSESCKRWIVQELPQAEIESGRMEPFLSGDPEASQKSYERNGAIIEATAKTHDVCQEMLQLALSKLGIQERNIFGRVLFEGV
jgi:hypothetical protein